MWQAYTKMWKGIIDIKGCTTRRDYWLAILCNIPILILVIFNERMLISLEREDLHSLANIEYLYTGQIILGLFQCLSYLASTTMVVRRLHDAGKSGWWWLLNLIPIIGWIVLIVFLCKESKIENNPYRQES